jgi:hypothetical protein
MAMLESLQVGLKEWAAVCAALEAGRQIVLLRKGGILEARGGFQIQHQQFLLFPTYLHQNAEMLKPDARTGLEPHAAEPSQIELRLAAEVTDIVPLSSRSQIDAIDDEHIWTPPLIDMRFNYKPKNPLYLLLLRCWRLPRAVTIQNTPAYAGCKSWVPLEQAVATTGARPVLDDSAHATRRQEILRRVQK